MTKPKSVLIECLKVARSDLCREYYNQSSGDCMSCPLQDANTKGGCYLMDAIRELEHRKPDKYEVFELMQKKILNELIFDWMNFESCKNEGRIIEKSESLINLYSEIDMLIESEREERKLKVEKMSLGENLV